MTDLRQAAQQAEPVALEKVYETIIQWDDGGGKRSRRELARRIVALYTRPQAREWVGLTKVQQDDFADAYGSYEAVCAIEAKLKEKNSD